MSRDDAVALVEIAGVYIMYFRKDHAFSHMLRDPRARVVDVSQAKPTWKFGEVDYHAAWDLRGMGLFSLSSIHYWRHGIDFDYVNIGANTGLTTIAQAVFYKRCGKNNMVYAFEPGEVFPLLEIAAKLNHVDDMTTCIRAAMTDRVGKAEFYLTPAQSPASSLLLAATTRPGVVESNQVVVDTTTLDAFSECLRPAAGLLVKIDAEGVDFKVIDGMQNVLASRICVVQIELDPALVDSYADPVTRLQALADDFEMIDVGATPHRRVTPGTGDVAAFVEGIRKQQTPTTDIFLVPKRLPSADDLVGRIIAG